MNGKGDKPRPVDRDKYQAGWERIFGNKDKEGTKNETDRSRGPVLPDAPAS